MTAITVKGTLAGELRRVRVSRRSGLHAVEAAFRAVFAQLYEKKCVLHFVDEHGQTHELTARDFPDVLLTNSPGSKYLRMSILAEDFAPAAPVVPVEAYTAQIAPACCASAATSPESRWWLSLLSDETVARGTSIAANSSFTKSWRVRVSDQPSSRLPVAEAQLRCVYGPSMGAEGCTVALHTYTIGEEVILSVGLQAPIIDGPVASVWRLFTEDGEAASDALRIDMHVTTEWDWDLVGDGDLSEASHPMFAIGQALLGER